MGKRPRRRLLTTETISIMKRITSFILFAALLLFASNSFTVLAALYENVVQMVPLSVDSFSFQQPDMDSANIHVEFIVSGGEGSYDYVVSAAIVENDIVAGSREIGKGSGQLGETTQIQCHIGDLNSYGRYSLILSVYKDYEGIEESETAVAQGVFSFVNNSMAPAPSGFDVVIDLTDFSVGASWEAFLDYYGDEWIFAVLDGSGEDFYVELGRGETGYATSFDPGASEITVELSYRRDGRVSSVHSKTILIEDILYFDFGEYSSSLQGKVSYNTPRDAFAEVSLFSPDDPSHYDGFGNEREIPFDQIRLSGSGFFSISFKEFSNNIEARWTFEGIDFSEHGTVWFSKHIGVYVDLLPPGLRLPENNSVIYTDGDYFDIVGATDFGTEVFIDGNSVFVNENGGFIASVLLEDGENTFVVTAMNDSGNRTTQVVTIVKTDPSGTVTESGVGFFEKNAVFLCSAFVSVVYFAFVFWFVRMFSRKWKLGRIEALADLVRNICTPFFALSLVFFVYALWNKLGLERYVNSMEFALTGLDDAGVLVNDVVAYQKGLILYEQSVSVLKIFSVVFGCTLFISIVVRVVVKFFPKLREFIGRLRGGKAPPAPVYSFFCPFCGAGFDGPVKFCGKCGRKID